MTTTALPSCSPVLTPTALPEFHREISELNDWLIARDYAGYEPYDLLNSPYLAGWAQHQPFATFFIQSGKRIGGLPLRRLLRVPPSRNPKALGLILAAYCDLARIGWDSETMAARVKQYLLRTRSQGESDYCWGYDWHYVSLRGARLPAFSPNSIATVFAANALLDHAETFHDSDSRNIAISAAHWLATRLQRSLEDCQQLCLSYTPHDRTLIFNNTALIGAFLARVDRLQRLANYSDFAAKTMQFLVNGQSPDGSWRYGLSHSQNWIDSFHTGYNLCALREYQRTTGDFAFSKSLSRGYEFYVSAFFRPNGAPRYFHNRTYPIDIHACSQAILTFCAFADMDPAALRRATEMAQWTIANFRNQNGSFGYQIHRHHQDRTPYVRWSQAWMLSALSRLQRQLRSNPA